MTKPSDSWAAARWNCGYDDASGWLPSASANELAQLLLAENGKGTVFIYPHHSLAKYWYSLGAPRGTDDVPAGDIDPWDPGYGAGFYAALHEKASSGAARRRHLRVIHGGDIA